MTHSTWHADENTGLKIWCWLLVSMCCVCSCSQLFTLDLPNFLMRARCVLLLVCKWDRYFLVPANFKSHIVPCSALDKYLVYLFYWQDIQFLWLDIWIEKKHSFCGLWGKTCFHALLQIAHRQDTTPYTTNTTTVFHFKVQNAGTEIFISNECIFISSRKNIETSLIL